MDISTGARSCVVSAIFVIPGICRKMSRHVSEQTSVSLINIIITSADTYIMFDTQFGFVGRVRALNH